MYRIEISSQIKKLPTGFQKKIRNSIVQIAQNPYWGKKLKGELNGYYSFKMWPYRIIYTIMQKEIAVIIVKVAHRQGVYK